MATTDTLIPATENIPDELPAWAKADMEVEAMPQWAKDDLSAPDLDAEFETLKKAPLDQRHALLGTGLFRSVDAEGNDAKPEGEFYVVPTQKAMQSGEYKKYQPDFKGSDILPAAGNLLNSLGQGIYKVSGPGMIANRIVDIRDKGLGEAVKNQMKLAPSIGEGLMQNLGFFKDIAGNLVSRPIANIAAPAELKEGMNYNLEVGDEIKKQRMAEGKSVTGEAMRAIGVPENVAAAADQKIDQDIAMASSMFADPTFIASGGLSFLTKASKVEKALYAANRMKLIEQGMKTMSVLDATKAADAQLLKDVSIWKRPMSQVPVIKPVVEAVQSATPEVAKKWASIAGTAAANPIATVAQGAGKTLQGAGKLLQRGSDWVLGPGVGPAVTRAAIASPALASGPVAGGIAMLNAVALGALPKVQGAIKVGQKMTTLGDLIETAGRAVKMGGDSKAIRTAGTLANEAGTREAAAIAAGIPIEQSIKGLGQRMKSPFIRNTTTAIKDFAQPAIKGAVVGGTLSAAAGHDVDEGIAPGVVFGLAGHGFGSFGKLLNPKLRDPAAAAAFAKYKLDSLKPEERAAWKKQDPRAIDFFGDVDFMVKSANDSINTPDGKPAIDVSYAGTPEEMRAAFLAGNDGKALAEKRARQEEILFSPESTFEQKASAWEARHTIDDTINKSSRASGWVVRDEATGKIKMVVNASRDLNIGQISHEGLGHVVDQIDHVLGDESPLKDSRDSMVASLIGVDTVNDAGQNAHLPGIYTEDDLGRLAEGYYARLGLKPKYDDVIVNPETGETKQVLSEESRQDILKELIAEHSNVFSKNAMAGNKDLVQHALDVSKSTDAEIAQMLADSEANGGNTSTLFQGAEIKNTPELERAAAERILSFVDATSSADSSLRTVGDYVGVPETVPITKRKIIADAKDAHEAVAKAQTYEEAVAARKAVDVLAEANIYGTAAKPRNIARAEAEREFTLQNGRKPTQAELNDLTEKILDESPRVLTNSKNAVYKAGDTPVLLTPRQQEMAHVDQTKTIKAALAGVPTDGDPGAMTLEVTADGKEIFNGKYFTPAQMKAIRAVPNALLPKSIKDNIAEINDVLRKKPGSLVEFVYHQAIKKGGNIPRTFRSVVPFSFNVTKADNTLVRTWDATAIYRDLQKEAAKRQSSILENWRAVDETDYSQAMERFVADMQKFGQNHAEGKKGSIDLDGNPETAYAKADAIAKFLGFGSDKVVDLDSDKGKARTYVRSFRMDRMYEVKPSLADPLPLNYWETKKGNYMPEMAEPLPEPLAKDPRLKGLIYNGQQDYGDGPVHYFTDKENGGTFIVFGEPTPEAVAEKMQAQSEAFKNAKPEGGTRFMPEIDLPAWAVADMEAESSPNPRISVAGKEDRRKSIGEIVAPQKALSNLSNVPAYR